MRPSDRVSSRQSKKIGFFLLACFLVLIFPISSRAMTAIYENGGTYNNYTIKFPYLGENTRIFIWADGSAEKSATLTESFSGWTSGLITVNLDDQLGGSWQEAKLMVVNDLVCDSGYSFEQCLSEGHSVSSSLSLSRNLAEPSKYENMFSSVSGEIIQIVLLTASLALMVFALFFAIYFVKKHVLKLYSRKG